MSITFVHLERINSSSKFVNFVKIKEDPKFMVHIKQLSVKDTFIQNNFMFHFTGVIDAVVKINEYVRDFKAENLVFDCESVTIHDGENLGRTIIKNIKMDYDVMNSLLVKLVDTEESYLQ